MTFGFAKDKKATVITVTSNRKTMLPLQGQNVCPAYSFVYPWQTTLAALGTVQLMVGLFNIGLGPGRTSTHPEDLTNLRAAYWLGAVAIASGFTTLSANAFPFVYWVAFTAFMNIIGSISSIIGVVLYSIDLNDSSLSWMCDDRFTADDYDNCRYMAYFAQRLLTSMDITLIILTALQIIICITIAVLAIKAVCLRQKRERATATCNTGIYQPVLKEVAVPSPGV